MEGMLGLVKVSCSSHHEVLVKGLWDNLLRKLTTDYVFRERSDRFRTSVQAHRMIMRLFLSEDAVSINDALSNDARSSLVGQASYEESLWALLEFMYTGTVSVRIEQLEDLLKTAQELDFKMLVDAVKSAQDNHRILVTPYTVMDTYGHSVTVEVLQSTNEVVDEAENRVEQYKMCHFDDEIEDVIGEVGEGDILMPENALNGDILMPGLESVIKTEVQEELVADSAMMSNSEYKVESAVGSRCFKFPLWDNQLTSGDQTKALPENALNGEPLFVCNECSLYFVVEAMAHEHMTLHPLQFCSQCSYSTRISRLYNDHVQGNHLVAPAAAETRSKSKTKKKRSKRTCPLCMFRCRSRRRLKAHTLAKHLDASAATETKKNSKKRKKRTKGTCPLCPFRYRSCQQLKAHFMVEHLDASAATKAKKSKKRKKRSKGTCPSCPFRYQSRQQLKVHTKAEHLSCRLFQCRLCFFESNRSRTIAYHMHQCHRNSLRPVQSDGIFTNFQMVSGTKWPNANANAMNIWQRFTIVATKNL